MITVVHREPNPETGLIMTYFVTITTDIPPNGVTVYYKEDRFRMEIESYENRTVANNVVFLNYSTVSLNYFIIEPGNARYTMVDILSYEPTTVLTSPIGEHDVLKIFGFGSFKTIVIRYRTAVSTNIVC